MHGNLLGLPMRSVRLLMFFYKTRSFDCVRRLWKYILLQCLRSEQQQNWMFDRILDPYLVLWPDEPHNLCRYATCDVMEDLWLPTSLIKVPLCFVADARLGSIMRVCLVCCLFLLQSDHSTELWRGSAGSLHDNLQSSIRAAFRTCVWRTRCSPLIASSDHEQLEYVLEWCCTFVPATPLFDPNCAGRWSDKSANLLPYGGVRFCGCSSVSHIRWCGSRRLRQWGTRRWEQLWEANRRQLQHGHQRQDENARAGWLWMTKSKLYLEPRSAQCVLTRKCAVARSRKCILCTPPVAFSELRLTGREKRNLSKKKKLDGGQILRVSSRTIFLKSTTTVSHG